MYLVYTGADLPVGGRLSHYYKNWHQVSRDPWVLDTVQGYRLEFHSQPQQRTRPSFHLDESRAEALTREVRELVDKRAIQPVWNQRGGFFSPMFVVPKGEGSWRPVINLKSLNTYLVPHHFKMEGIRVVKSLIQKGDWMVKLDLKDAFLSVPIHPTHRKYLRFQWEEQAWEFQTLPFGLSSAPYVFTKLLKPAVATLHRLGMRLVLYLDDMLILAQTREMTRECLATALELLLSLGFIINLKKSVLNPTQKIEFLGFQIDSQRMTISLPQQKIKSLKQRARHLCRVSQVSVREIAQILGLMISVQPAILPVPLFYWKIERLKIQALREQRSYDAKVTLTEGAKSDLHWWASEMERHNGRNLQILQWDMVLESDASKEGWGANHLGVSTGGLWTQEEQKHHINYLELLAAFLALKTFARDCHSVAILLRIDNVTAIAFVNKMGGPHSTPLSNLAVEMWKWCCNRTIFVHAEHLPGKENVRADWESRHARDSSDWMIRRDIFQQLEEELGPFTIDLFASRTNAQLPTYCSWRPDPHAMAVDALSIPWRKHLPYMFPPFALINRCLDKVREEGVDALMIAPVWQNQAWYPTLLQMLVSSPVLLPETQDILAGPRGEYHPMAMEGHLPLAAWPISGSRTAAEDFLKGLSRCSASPGGAQQSLHMLQLGDSGVAGVLNGVSIPFQHL